MTDFNAATDLVEQHLSRAVGYPSETRAFVSLVNGLVKAELVSNVPAGRIAERCAELSKFCPTDYDLLSVARDMARCDAVAAGTFDSMAGAGNAVVDAEKLREEYGEPAPFDSHKIDMDRVKRVKDRERKLLAEIKALHPGDISWHQMAKTARSLGYEDYARAWEKGVGVRG